MWHGYRKSSNETLWKTLEGMMKPSKPKILPLIEAKGGRNKFLGVEESIRSLLLKEVEKLYVEALKEEYIGYGGRTPFEMIQHL